MRAPALALLAGALLLAGCGGGSKSSSQTTTAATTAPVRTVTAQPVTRPAEPKATVITIRIKDGKPGGGITRVTVEKPQRVELVVHSDVADEVHVHGYDLHQDVEAGGTARIGFPATIQGVFEAELENRKLQILELTVK
jgi:ABC-type glycerol-3-phosphate transport system substrate-binding protein